jgi:antitoxin CcdA
MAEPIAATRRKPVNVSIQQRLIDEARAAGLNLSGVLEEALNARLRERRAARWKEENREAMQAFGRYIERHGIFGDTEERGF